MLIICYSHWQYYGPDIRATAGKTKLPKLIAKMRWVCSKSDLTSVWSNKISSHNRFSLNFNQDVTNRLELPDYIIIDTWVLKALRCTYSIWAWELWIVQSFVTYSNCKALRNLLYPFNWFSCCETSNGIPK